MISEAEIKYACEEYLQIGMNMGKWVYLRLNAGDFIEVRGGTRRRIRGCPKGTADLVVMQQNYFDIYDEMPWATTTVIFIEVKSEKGRWAPGQRAFKKLVEAQGAEYKIVRDVSELMELLPMEG